MGEEEGGRAVVCGEQFLSLSARGARVESNPSPLRSGAILSFDLIHDLVFPQRGVEFWGLSFSFRGPRFPSAGLFKIFAAAAIVYRI